MALTYPLCAQTSRIPDAPADLWRKPWGQIWQNGREKARFAPHVAPQAARGAPGNLPGAVSSVRQAAGLPQQPLSEVGSPLSGEMNVPFSCS